jgi:hypothetical protein
MAERALRVQFAHGLESSVQGNKARFFAQHYDACTPSMNTRDFESCVAVHAGTAARFEPDLMVGSSFGGAVVVALLQRGLWRGPVLLLAQAARKYDPNARLPTGVRATLVHARQDDVVPFEHSQSLVAGCDPSLVELIACDDNHALSGLLDSGKLPGLVARACLPRVPV